MITRHEIPNHPDDVALQVWVSEDDDELDYTFLVPAERENDARTALAGAYVHWFVHDPDLTLFEELELSLKECGIPYATAMAYELEARLHQELRPIEDITEL